MVAYEGNDGGNDRMMICNAKEKKRDEVCTYSTVGKENMFSCKRRGEDYVTVMASLF